MIRRDEYGRWLVGGPGTRYQKGSDPPRIDEHGFVVLVSTGWWTAYFNAVPRTSSGSLVYVDINSAARWHGPAAELVDLDLDVVLAADGTTHLLDEDEFDEHRELYGYPPDVVDRTRATAAAVYGMIERGEEPFGSAGFRLVTEHLGWSHGHVVAGHGAASGATTDPRFPEGTLALQWPHFEREGIDLSEFHRATLNVQLPVELVPHSPTATITSLTWLEGYPAETFEFCDARIAHDGRVLPALWYRPHPDTKPEFYQSSGVVELLAPRIDGVTPGDPVSVWIDPSQVDWIG